MKATVLNFWRDEEGATAIEYGLMAALIAIVAMVGMKSLGVGLSTIFQNIGDELSGVDATVDTSQ